MWSVQIYEKLALVTQRCLDFSLLQLSKIISKKIQKKKSLHQPSK